MTVGRTPPRAALRPVPGRIRSTPRPANEADGARRRYHSIVMARPNDEVTRLLEAWTRGDPQALEKLMPLVVDDLRSIASKYFEREDPDHTLQPTALVNELFMRLIERRSVHWKNPSHFFRAAARMMRRLLVDHARHRHAAKRGGNAVKLPFTDEIPFSGHYAPADLIALDEALERLKTMEPRQSEVVELKWFVGLTIEEIAETLGIKPTTVKSDWRIARAWLVHELGHDEDD